MAGHSERIVFERAGGYPSVHALGLPGVPGCIHALSVPGVPGCTQVYPVYQGVPGVPGCTKVYQVYQVACTGLNMQIVYSHHYFRPNGGQKQEQQQQDKSFL